MDPRPLQLDPRDRDLVLALARATGQPELDLLGQIGATSPEGPSRVVDGRFVTLSLRDLGPPARWSLGEEASVQLSFRALDALEQLDVTGLGLDAIDVAGLSRLRVLRCAENRLRHLSLEGATALEVLECEGNELMWLDLAEQPRLRQLECGGNQLVAVKFATPSRLQVLRCSRNDLMVLSLPDHPELVELVCTRNALVRLELGPMPLLERLDVARNDLMELSLGVHPRLVELGCARNRLGGLALGGCPALRVLDCAGNYIESLDLRANTELARLDARANQLASLQLGACPKIEVIDCAENRLTDLDLRGCPALVELRCAGNELTELDLSHNEALGAVDCSANSLRALGLGRNRALVELGVADNDLSAVDIRANPLLCRLELGSSRAPEVVATDTQRHRISSLRNRLGLGTGSRDIRDMDPWELHEFAASYRGPDAEARLMEVVRSPRCDLGTALMVYWTSSPHYYLRYADRTEVERYQVPGWDLLAEIERRVREGAYTRQEIWFDPRHDTQTRSVRGHDWTRPPPAADEGRPRRAIPEAMAQPSRAQP